MLHLYIMVLCGYECCSLVVMLIMVVVVVTCCMKVCCHREWYCTNVTYRKQTLQTNLTQYIFNTLLSLLTVNLLMYE